MTQLLLSCLKKYKWSTAFVVIFTGLLILMPIALQTGLQQLLLKKGQAHGIDRVEISDIDFNPFMATFSLSNLTLYRDQTLVAEIKQLDLRLRLRELLQKRLIIDSFTLSDTHIPLRLTVDNQLEIAGFPIPLDSTPESEPEAENSELGIQFGIKTLHISNTTISLESHDENTTYSIDDMIINEESDYARLILSSHLNKTPLNANLQLHLLTDSPKIVGTVSLKQLKLSEFKQFIPDLPLTASISNDITFTLQKDNQGFALYQQGNWSITGLEFKQDQQKLTLKNFDWKGDIHFFAANTSANPEKSPFVKLRGQANLTDFNFSDGKNQTELSHEAIADLDLVAILDTQKPTISQTGKLVIKQFKLDSPSINSQSTQATWQGKVDFIGGENSSIKTQGVLAMTDVMTSLPAQKINLQHQLQANLNLLINLDNTAKNGLSIQQDGDFSLGNLVIKQAPFELDLKQTAWNGTLNFAQTPVKENSEPSYSILSTGQLKAAGLRAFDQQNQLTLAQFETLDIGNLLVKQLANLSLENIQLSNLKVAQSKDLKQPGLVTLNNLKLDRAQLQNFNLLKLGTLELQGSESHLTLDKDGRIEQLIDLLASLSNSESEVIAKAPAQPATDVKKISTFSYQLEGIKTSNSHQIYLTSHQAKPAFVKTIQLTFFTLGKFNSQKPLEPTPYNLALKLDEFSRLNSQGSLQPLNPKFNLEAKTKLEDLSLFELSPPIEQKLGYQVKSGQLSVEATTQIKDNVIDAENRIHLNKFVITAADKSKTALIEKEFSMPLEAGLALLKDKNDNIDLKLPIKGDLNTPDFQLQSVISRAINSSLVKASRTYLLLALQPFGAILLAGEFAVDQLSAVKLQAVTFAPGDSTLSLEMLVYTAKIHKVLDERKSIQIKLCGGANELDRQALLQQAIEAGKTENSASKTPVITDAQLLNLAEERQAVIKRHLIKIGSQSKQIILCQPKITASKQPSVDLGI